MFVNDGTGSSDDQAANLLQSVQSVFGSDSPVRIGVAVSGGGDSMALLHLLARVASSRGHIVQAATVNHCLRPEAADEAAFVAGVCAGLGIRHDSMLWDHGEITGNLQDQARRARYRLLADWARENGIYRVALGHTADDQAETFLMRLARGAGVDGLSGMRPEFQSDGVVFCRPLLARTRAELRQYLGRNRLAWVDDPSNDDLAYQRVRARRALALLAPLGIDAPSLIRVGTNLGAAKSALDHYARAEAGKLAKQDAGDLILARAPSPPVPGEIERRLLVAGLMWVSGAEYPPRDSALNEMQTALAHSHTFTLAGCIVTLKRSRDEPQLSLRITREWNAVKAISTRTDHPWDGRWVFDGPHAAHLRIRALGADGLRECPDWRASGRPRATLMASPAVWHGETLVSAPIAGYGNGWQAELSPEWGNFAAFLIGR